MNLFLNLKDTQISKTNTDSRPNYMLDTNNNKCNADLTLDSQQTDNSQPLKYKQNCTKA